MSSTSQTSRTLSADTTAASHRSRRHRTESRGRSLVETREGHSAYAFIAPTTVLLAVFYLWPLAQTVGYSFTNWNPATGEVGGSVGAANFTALMHDANFLGAIRNTALYVVIQVPCTLALGLILAAILAKPFHGRGVYRTLLFVPYIAPIVGSSLIFSYLLSPLGGIVNGVLQGVGVPPDRLPHYGAVGTHQRDRVLHLADDRLHDDHLFRRPERHSRELLRGSIP